MEKTKELNMNELEQVNGGGLCFGWGLGFDAAACIRDGVSVIDEIFDVDSTAGFGATVCMLVGYGFGEVTNDKWQ